MASITASLSLHLLCQLIAQNPGSQSNVSHIGITTGNRARLPAGYVSHPDIGFAYKIHNENATFPEAESRCKAEGGHLATIDSEKKKGYAREMSESRKAIWVGIFQIYNRDWISIGTGLPVNVLWGKGEPSGGFACVLMIGGIGEMGNYDCYTHQIPFICELPVPQHNSAGGN